MKKILLIIPILLVAAACNQQPALNSGQKQAQNQNNTGQTSSTIQQGNVSPEPEIPISPKVNPAPKPTPAPAPTPTPTPIPPTSGNTPPQPQQMEKDFTVEADDNSASLTTISVNTGDTVNITFKVKPTGVYYGGLDFRSSNISTGTIYSGQSKIISFVASQSFSFTPYWPSSGVAKPYKINVVVN